VWHSPISCRYSTAGGSKPASHASRVAAVTWPVWRYCWQQLPEDWLTFNWRITARPNHLCVCLGTVRPLYVLFAQNKPFVTWAFSCLAGCLYFLRFRLLKKTCRTSCWQFIETCKRVNCFFGLCLLPAGVNLTPVKGWKRCLTLGSTATNSLTDQYRLTVNSHESQIFWPSSGLFSYLL